MTRANDFIVQRPMHRYLNGTLSAYVHIVDKPLELYNQNNNSIYDSFGVLPDNYIRTMILSSGWKRGVYNSTFVAGWSLSDVHLWQIPLMKIYNS